MPTILWVLAYYTGLLVTLRQYVLYVETLRERRVKSSHRAQKWSQQREAPFVAFIPWLWPLFAVAWLSWKLIFPRGVKTKQAKDVARQAALDATRKEDERLLAEAQKLVQAWRPPQLIVLESAPEPVEDVLTYEVAAKSFNGACDQVWETRGRPWSIGSLAKIRTRAKART